MVAPSTGKRSGLSASAEPCAKKSAAVPTATGVARRNDSTTKLFFDELEDFALLEVGEMQNVNERRPEVVLFNFSTGFDRRRKSRRQKKDNGFVRQADFEGVLVTHRVENAAMTR